MLMSIQRQAINPGRKMEVADNDGKAEAHNQYNFDSTSQLIYNKSTQQLRIHQARQIVVHKRRSINENVRQQIEQPTKQQKRARTKESSLAIVGQQVLAKQQRRVANREQPNGRENEHEHSARDTHDRVAQQIHNLPTRSVTLRGEHEQPSPVDNPLVPVALPRMALRHARIGAKHDAIELQRHGYERGARGSRVVAGVAHERVPELLEQKRRAGPRMNDASKMNVEQKQVPRRGHQQHPGALRGRQGGADEMQREE
ncbi:Dolichyl-phosphate-mannose--protein mannosyltransferase family GT39 [Gracilaria domingensis]|nr:Dolichyl-phosphate-mannose--protein mannosyltransferase family GT39 [Gracilaria domingensis]